MSGSGLQPLFSKSGTLAATGSSEGLQFSKPFNIVISGTWVGSWALEASTDGGTTWVNCLKSDLTASSCTVNGFSAVSNIWERGVLYRITFTRTSGTLDWRMSR